MDGARHALECVYSLCNGGLCIVTDRILSGRLDGDLTHDRLERVRLVSDLACDHLERAP